MKKILSCLCMLSMVIVLAGGLFPAISSAEEIPCEATDVTQEIVSNTDTQVDSHDAVAVTPHPAWTASIPDATWIYSDALDENGSSPTGDKVFTRTFNITGTPLDSTLDIAADNMYSVTVNGNNVGSD